MLRKAVLGTLAMVGLLVFSTGTASAYWGHHHGYGYGCRPGYYYRGYAPRVVVAPPVYGYPAVGAYGVAPGYGYGAYTYGQPGVGVTTPGFGFYVR